MNQKIQKTLLSLVLCSSLVACGNERSGPDGTSPYPFDVVTSPSQIELPQGTTPLSTLSEDAAMSVLHATNRFINLARVGSLDRLRGMYKEAAQARGMNGALLDRLTDEAIQERWASMYPLSPHMKKRSSVGEAESNTSQLSQAIGIPHTWEVIRACPLLAPETDASQTTSEFCQALIDEVDQKFEDQLAEAITAEKERIEGEFANPDSELVQNVLEQLDMEDVEDAKKFMIAWATEAITFAEQAARLAMIEELRDQGECDIDMDRSTACRLVGVADTIAMTTDYRYFNNMTAWEVVEALDESCSLNWMTTIDMIRRVLVSKKAEFIHEEHFCVGYDYNRDNPAYIECNDLRLQGVAEGIENEIVRMSMILQGFSSTSCPLPPGDPLVIDLDGDGISLAEGTVNFDAFATGKLVRMTWVGPRDGLLALDRNGNGRIDSMAELFGDQSLCESGRCSDGIAALAAYDSNADGRIDDADPIFQELLIWVDSNGDGVSQPDELAPLFSAGIQAISLERRGVAPADLGRPVVDSVAVTSTSGNMVAYDVMLNLTPSMESLAGFGPPQRK